MLRDHNSRVGGVTIMRLTRVSKRDAYRSAGLSIMQVGLVAAVATLVELEWGKKMSLVWLATRRILEILKFDEDYEYPRLSFPK